ncbi:MAG: hypothetical protein WC960_04880 [Bacteroidales bacterium]
MTTFELELFQGHAIIKEGGNIMLIDTGAPSTIHINNNLIFCGESHSCSTNYLGLTIEGLSELLGMEVTTLIGCDILSAYGVLFDYRNKAVTFYKEGMDSLSNEIELGSFMGVPTIGLGVEGQKLNFFLDTGAKLSYLDNKHTSQHPSIGREEDFHPSLGKFETECYQLTTLIGDKEFSVKYGNLPSLLQMRLTLSSIDGIIGSDLFNSFKIYLDIKNRKLGYE